MSMSHRRLSGGSGTTGTTSIGAGSRDVTNLTTVVALLSQLCTWPFPTMTAYSSASLLGALSGDVTLLSAVLVHQL